MPIRSATSTSRISRKVKAILDRAVSFKPRRQIIILFSGGEPTLSPHFLEAVAYAKKIGFYRILAATNGIRFAQSEEFTRQAREAGLHGTYLQFDGTTNEKNQHRGVANLFDVKLQAIENMAKVGMKTTLVTTVVKRINNDAIGPIVDFAIHNIDKVQTVVFQPVSFTGRDEEIDDESRYAQRYTLSQLVEDLKVQLKGRLGADARLVPAFHLQRLYQRHGYSAGARMRPGAGVPATAIPIAAFSACWSSTAAPMNGSRYSSFSTTSGSYGMWLLITDTRPRQSSDRSAACPGDPAQLPGGQGPEGISHFPDRQSVPAQFGKSRQRQK